MKFIFFKERQQFIADNWERLNMDEFSDEPVTYYTKYGATLPELDNMFFIMLDRMEELGLTNAA